MSLWTEPLVVAGGVVAVLVGLMVWNGYLDARARAAAQKVADRSTAARAASTVRYLTHDGTVLGAIVDERDGQILVESAGTRYVVAAQRVRQQDGEWVLTGSWDAEAVAAARAAAAAWG